ncbi:MAG: HD family hydrolase [Rhizobiales bacterium]|nr:HD family hydrolase [Hyphomicrobiales bacterium]
MLSGRRLDLINPSPLDIEIEDIAHGLARVSRWNGQTLGDHPYSVAQHSILVESLALALRPGWPDCWCLAALLHDAPEYVVGDLISPFKAALSLDYKEFEAALLAAIHLRFALPTAVPKAVTSVIKRADRMSAYFEATRLAGFTETEAAQIFGRPRGLNPDLVQDKGLLEPWPARKAERTYLDHFEAKSRSLTI